MGQSHVRRSGQRTECLAWHIHLTNSESSMKQRRSQGRAVISNMLNHYERDGTFSPFPLGDLDLLLLSCGGGGGGTSVSSARPNIASST